MNSTEQVQIPAHRSRASSATRKRQLPPFPAELLGPARNAIVKARHALIDAQRSGASRTGFRSADPGLAARLVILLEYLEQQESKLVQQCATGIIARQRDDGGWSAAAADDSSDVSRSVLCYFALKLAGLEGSDERLHRARRRIRELGGADAVDGATRLFLALLGQLSYDYCPRCSAERSFRGDAKSAINAAMGIVWLQRPVHSVDIQRGIRELFIEHPGRWPKAGRLPNRIRRAIQSAERLGWLPLKKRRLNQATTTLLDATASRENTGLNFSRLVWKLIALRAVGISANSDEFRDCFGKLQELIDIDDEQQIAWPRNPLQDGIDETISLRALIESGLTYEHHGVRHALRALNGPGSEAENWSLTSICAMVHGVTRLEAQADDALVPELDICSEWDWPGVEDDNSSEERDDLRARLKSRCVETILSRQNLDGGWPETAGLRCRRSESCASATGRAIEALRSTSLAAADRLIAHGEKYLRRSQRADGSWTDLGDAKGIESTASALRGLAASESALHRDDAVEAAVNWLVTHQHPDGSWNASVTETATVVGALVVVGMSGHVAVRRGVAWLIDAQDFDGEWRDDLADEGDSHSLLAAPNAVAHTALPLTALAQWAAAAAVDSLPADQMSLRLVAAGNGD